MTETSLIVSDSPIEKHRIVLETALIISLLTASLIGIYWIGTVWLQVVALLLWTWLTVFSALYFKERATSADLLSSMMYVLIASTFLNQVLLSLSVGFFTLFIYRLLLITCLVVFLAHSVKIGGFYKEWKTMPVKGIIYFLMFWMAYGAVSLLWSWSVIEGIKYLFLLGIGLLFIFLAVFTFTRVDHLIAFHMIWLLMSGLLITIGMLNHFGHIQLPTSTLYGGPDYKQAYPTAVFTNQNDFATMLAISFFFYLAAARHFKKPVARATCLVLAAASVWLIYLTESRASLLGVAAGGILYLFLLLPAKYKKGTLLFSLCLTVGGLLVISGKLFVKLQGLVAPYTAYSVNENPSSNTVRVHLLQSGWHYLTETFGIGVGAGNLPVYLEHQPILNTNHIFEIHNWLAELTGNFGFLIGAGYLAMYLTIFVSLYKIYAKQLGRKAKLLLETCMTAQIAFLVSSISPSSISNLYFHWVFLGFVICTVSVLSQSQQKPIQSGEA
ncbi:MAG: TuaE [Sporolactobacillus laevolacticus]|jgi:teichuronic acid biosynthesis protein TuaE|nr:TuaE [Sporolactobacillus laevolacticus]